MIVAAAILLTLLALVFTLAVREKDLPDPIPASPFDHQDERKARIYENLRDLQFEFRVGKLSEEDYQRAKLVLQQELAAVLAEIDQIKARLGQKPAAAAPLPKPAPDANVCPHCGARFAQALKFCGECGKPMTKGPA